MIYRITAQQLNRSGASIVDAALQAKKEDVTRLVGRDAIAGAWEINILRFPRLVINVKITSLIAGNSYKDNQQPRLNISKVHRLSKGYYLSRVHLNGNGKLLYNRMKI